MIESLIQISQDFYFWLGLTFFFFSVLFLRWILRLLQMETDDSSPMIREVEKPFTLTPQAPVEMSKGNLDSVLERLNRIEKLLNQIADQLENRPVHLKNDAANAGQGSVDLNQLTVKMEKLYQTLVALSSPEQKP